MTKPIANYQRLARIAEIANGVLSEDGGVRSDWHDWHEVQSLATQPHARSKDTERLEWLIVNCGLSYIKNRRDIDRFIAIDRRHSRIDAAMRRERGK